MALPRQEWMYCCATTVSIPADFADSAELDFVRHPSRTCQWKPLRPQPRPTPLRERMASAGYGRIAERPLALCGGNSAGQAQGQRASFKPIHAAPRRRSEARACRPTKATAQRLVKGSRFPGTFRPRTDNTRDKRLAGFPSRRNTAPLPCGRCSEARDGSISYDPSGKYVAERASSYPLDTAGWLGIARRPGRGPAWGASSSS